jgi:hypothetical protein
VKLLTNEKHLMMKIWPLLMLALPPSEQGDKHDQETKSVPTHHHFAIRYFSGS